MRRNQVSVLHAHLRKIADDLRHKLVLHRFLPGEVMSTDSVDTREPGGVSGAGFHGHSGANLLRGEILRNKMRIEIFVEIVLSANPNEAVPLRDDGDIHRPAYGFCVHRELPSENSKVY
jgi:hypothetical protein